jgi:NAD-reducing hydrogenase small subunit
MTPKPKLATVWLGGCSGCHMSFLDMDERLIELAGEVELLASPITDFKDFPVEDVVNRSYQENTTIVIGRPGVSGPTPALLDKVRPVHEVVQVDYFLQGCPPDADAIYALLRDLLSGRPPRTDGRKFG